VDYPLVVASRAAGHRTRKLAMRTLDEIGLFPGQEVVLLELAARGELNQAELAHALDVEPPSVTGILAKLEAGGLVARVVVGREKHVTLTNTGRRAVAKVHDAYAAMERALTSNLTSTQVAALMAALILVGVVVVTVVAFARAGATSHWSHWLVGPGVGCLLWWVAGVAIDAADSFTPVPSAAAWGGVGIVVFLARGLLLIGAAAIAVRREIQREDSCTVGTSDWDELHSKYSL
jgi:MarR family transcriptional regulator, organic hydroperoxide resistance regulator